MRSFFFCFFLVCITCINSNAQSGWTLQTNPLGSGDSAMVGKIQFVSATEGWISLGSGARLLHTTDAGANWTVVKMSVTDSVASLSDPGVNLSFVNSTTGWVIKSFGNDFSNMTGAVIYKTTNGGIDWQRKIISQNDGDLGFQIQFIDANIGWATVANLNSGIGYIYKTTDGGNNWNVISSGSFRMFYFVDAMNGWSISLGADSPPPPYYIMRTTDGGATWSTQFTDNTQGEFITLHIVDLTNGWVVGRNGKVLTTTNGGTNWNLVTNTGIIAGQSSKSVYFLDSNTGWFSTKDDDGYAIIKHTTDRGASWSTQVTPLQDPQGGNSVFSMCFYDAQNGWLAADYGKICRYSGTTGVEENNSTPGKFYLDQNYPNPFNPITKIRWHSPVSGHQTLKVYDVLGNEIATFVDEFRSEGSYEVEFTASALASGIYFYKLQAGAFVQTRKMILMK